MANVTQQLATLNQMLSDFKSDLINPHVEQLISDQMDLGLDLDSAKASALTIMQNRILFFQNLEKRQTPGS